MSLLLSLFILFILTLTGVCIRARHLARRQSPTSVRITETALKRLVRDVHRHVEHSPGAGMGWILLGQWRGGVPWITSILEQAPISNENGMNSNSDFQSVLFRLSMAAEPENRLLGLARFVPPGKDSPPSFLRDHLSWLGQDGAPRPGIFLFLSLTGRTGFEDGFEDHSNGTALRYRGVELSGSLLKPGASRYREVRIESGCGRECGRTAAFLRYVTGRYCREIESVLENFKGAEVYPLWMDLNPAIAVTFDGGDFLGVNLLTSESARCFAIWPGGEWKEYMPSSAKDLAMTNLDMMIAMKKAKLEAAEAVSSTRSSKMRCPRKLASVFGDIICRNTEGHEPGSQALVRAVQMAPLPVLERDEVIRV